MSRLLQTFCAILALLLMAPALQAGGCEMPQAVATMDHMALGHHDRQAPAPSGHDQRAHDCIGCTAPIDIGAYAPTERVLLKASADVRPLPAAFAHGLSLTPEPPPPRLTV